MDTTSSTAIAPSNALFRRQMDDCTAGMSMAARNRDISNKNPATAMAAESRVIDFVLLSCDLTPLLGENRENTTISPKLKTTKALLRNIREVLTEEDYQEVLFHKRYHYSARYFPSRVRTIALSRGSQLDLERKWKWSLKRATNTSKYRDNHELEQSTKPIEYLEADSSLENYEDVWSALDLSTEPRVTTIVKVEVLGYFMVSVSDFKTMQICCHCHSNQTVSEG
ncbi:hypothetical protein BGX24_005843 [Mortierella sp. AD032]|nr:hypothetical protein BGX24_005843 [Mortierella sp. AD032]